MTEEATELVWVSLPGGMRVRVRKATESKQAKYLASLERARAAKGQEAEYRRNRVLPRTAGQLQNMYREERYRIRKKAGIYRLVEIPITENIIEKLVLLGNLQAKDSYTYEEMQNAILELLGEYEE